MNQNIAGIVNQKINWLMFEPYKNMRTVFQVRRIKANLAAGVLQKDILAEFQIRPCNQLEALKKQFFDRKMKMLE